MIKVKGEGIVTAREFAKNVLWNLLENERLVWRSKHVAEDWNVAVENMTDKQFEEVARHMDALVNRLVEPVRRD